MARPAGSLIPPGTWSTAAAIAARPELWRAALHQVRVLAPERWWSRPPFLPLPDRDWMAFRMTTAYGDPGAPFVADDVVTWLRWSKSAAAIVGAEG